MSTSCTAARLRAVLHLLLPPPPPPPARRRPRQSRRHYHAHPTSALPSPGGSGEAASGTGSEAVARPAVFTGAVRAAAGDANGVDAEREAHKELNRRICAAGSAGAVLELVVGAGGGGLRCFNLVNAVTAFHRLARHGMHLLPAQRQTLAAHPTTRQLAAWLQHAVASTQLTDFQAAQLLWGHAQLEHGTGELVDAVYAQLADAGMCSSGSGQVSKRGEADTSTGVAPSSSENAAASRGGGGSCGSSQNGTKNGGRMPLQLESMSTAVTLTYAMARLQRPQPHLLQCLTAALLAADESAVDSTAIDRSITRESRQGKKATRKQQQQRQQQGQGQNISLAACDARSLCLLLWSLATLKSCPPALLAGGCDMLRRAGLTGLSVQSMTQVLQAQALSGWWDQSLVDEVAAELARQWRTSQQQQGEEKAQRRSRAPQQWQRQQPPRQRQQGAFRLNELDACMLTRCLALAWQQAVAASPAGPEAAENRLAHGHALQRHIAASPHRRAAAHLLAVTARQLAPHLAPQGLSSLAHSFASLGGCSSGLLEALAGRAIDLEQQLDAQAVATLAWAYSMLRYDHLQLYASLAAATLRLLAASPGDAGCPHGDGCGRVGFTAQAVSVVVFSFASANRCGSPEQRHMMLALAERAGELLRRWRALVGAAAPNFKPAELNQLHLVEVALRLEAPGIGLDLPSESARFFEGLYQTGRLRAFAGHAWQRTLADGPRSVTNFQRQVYRTLCALGVACQLEYSPAGEYSIDIALPQHRVAVEVDGPVHFAANSRHPMGGTVLKRRLLQCLGWRTVDVPFFEWWELAPERRRQYMLYKLEAAGLHLPGEGEAEGQHEERQEEQAAAGQVAVVEVSTQQQQQEQQQAAAAAAQLQPGDPGPSSNGEGAAAAAGPGVAQRAQRLRLLQFRQGRLSRMGLLTRGTMQATAATAMTVATAAGGEGGGEGGAGRPAEAAAAGVAGLGSGMDSTAGPEPSSAAGAEGDGPPSEHAHKPASSG